MPEKPISPNTLVAGAQRRRVARPLLHVLADRVERGSTLASQDLFEDGDLTRSRGDALGASSFGTRERRLGLVAAS